MLGSMLAISSAHFYENFISPPALPSRLYYTPIGMSQNLKLSFGHELLSTWLTAALKVSIFYGLWLTQP